MQESDKLYVVVMCLFKMLRIKKNYVPLRKEQLYLFHLKRNKYNDRHQRKGHLQHSVHKNETKGMYGDVCRMKSLGKTPHAGAEGGLAAPAESEVHFRSDIFTQNFGPNQHIIKKPALNAGILLYPPYEVVTIQLYLKQQLHEQR